MRPGKEMRHLVEDYDHELPSEYKTKEFSRMSKDMVRAQPNHLGDTIRSHANSLVGQAGLGIIEGY